VHLLLISGSTRAASGNTATLRTLAELTPIGSSADLYDGLTILPAFNPDDDEPPLPPAVAELRERIDAADAVVFCTPEYAGTIPGSLKNLLEWTVKGAQLYEKPVAWVNVANAGRGDGAQAHLEIVLGYVGALVVESACLRTTVNGRFATRPGCLRTRNCGLSWVRSGLPSRKHECWSSVGSVAPGRRVFKDFCDLVLRLLPDELPLLGVSYEGRELEPLELALVPIRMCEGMDAVKPVPRTAPEP
jgi:chromate reductase, NAD(P)H dehydrogenase (quinone)